MKKLILISTIVLTTALLSACQTVPESPVKTDLIETNYKAVDALLQGVTLNSEQPLLVATLVNVNELTESSSLGRLFSEQIAARLAKRGLQIKELKLRDNLFIKQTEGELMLSREVTEVSKSHKAQAVVVGTYAVSPSMVYINLKIVNPNGNLVISAHDYAMPIDANIRGLLPKSMTSSYAYR
ncbi:MULTISPECIES: FlgO family outer membrane protein [Aquitalea]|uniref:FlgO domain-containing protein n=1 Tax=Aquitalea magnusonii TaxID=332411 RepID=A0A318J498_9NEIS|nr:MULTISPECIES: FlgO family outer membrane protein [Aquitalea]PXX43476.1 hypothetical protein DFR38_115104 [Aquitalea magnusonii]